MGTEARIAGTLVHRWLELITTGRASRHHAAVTRRWLRETGIGADAADAIAERVEAALTAVLADPKGRWLLDGPGHAELALSGVYEGEVAAIVLDRVRIDGETHWIVDYKTSSHEGGNLRGFLAAETARYAPQLKKYGSIYRAWAGVAPRCALYFPLLGEFVEVDWRDAQ